MSSEMTTRNFGLPLRDADTIREPCCFLERLIPAVHCRHLDKSRVDQREENVKQCRVCGKPTRKDERSIN